MTNTRYFGGNTTAAFTTTGTIADNTTAGRFDSSYTSSGILLATNGTDYAETAVWNSSATGTVWIKFDMNMGYFNNNTGVGPTLYNGSTPIFHIRMDGFNNYMYIEYWTGSAWSGSLGSYNSTGLHTHMIKVVLGTSLTWYVDGVQKGSGGAGSQTTATKMRFYSVGSHTNSYITISQVMIANFNISNSHLYYLPVNGDSTNNTGGSGTYTDVNDNSDATYEYQTSAGTQMGQTHTAKSSLPANTYIGGMVVAARGQVNGTITNAKLGVRSNVTNYPTGSLNPGATWTGMAYIWETDPDTATTWTVSGLDAAEPYFEAV